MKPVSFLILSTLAAAVTACSSSQKVYLLSQGDWNGRKLPEIQGLKGEIRKGEDCGFKFSLAQAFANALKDTKYDTILDAEVTQSASVLVPFNCISIRGFALDSAAIQKENGQ
ncbi:hypothetical protein [Leptospira sanjuanensis]|uniref:hypothetical protein n=1 Tax=Leptospira sanjuanensis TaxID=2879643 RepID=UPI001EE953BA|nr:hypothetical protein [Leptospira sanjuanensis]MCG6169330.1 hypothetical protein [Leptospira sanjuanensis]